MTNFSEQVKDAFQQGSDLGEFQKCRHRLITGNVA